MVDNRGTITIPHNFTPRSYQIPLYNAIANGYKRGVSVWHRRAGKDKTHINLVAKETQKVVGTYYYFFPTYNQGRKILWDGMDRSGFKFMDHFPQGMRKSTNSTEMKIALTNGSIFQIIGTDNIDSVVGTNPIGCVFSEYSLQDPRAWEFMRPVLAENDGWAFFNYTPRGHNHAFRLNNIAKNNPTWFYELLTVDDTRAISQAAIEAERRDGMTEEMIIQEFYCSFEAPIIGAYYGNEMMAAEKDKRICKAPVEPGVEVNAFFDLGIDDSTTIWLAQDIGREVRQVGYYTCNNEAMSHYANWLKEWRTLKRAVIGTCVFPHDGSKRELTSGISAMDVMGNYGFECDIVDRPRSKIRDGIEPTRQFLGRCWFDEEGCSQGLDALRNYRKTYSEENKVYGTTPVHDWASHGADSMQTCALWHRGQPRSLDNNDNNNIGDTYGDGSQNENSWMGV